MSAAFGILVIAVAALLAWIAQLKHKRATAIGLVVLVGILVGNAPGTIGNWSESAADFVYELPKTISAMVG
ncbi:hypothetical protein OG271_04125 [Micromonospora rifamycinica]|uniref:hypothetical protein n=1 Tax=Micromonospora rifamycinica TaxID=291594 RepID=UPI002E2B1F7B|nr:hypothetical protein [Micromonospora rifamycinica]